MCMCIAAIRYAGHTDGQVATLGLGRLGLDLPGIMQGEMQGRGTYTQAGAVRVRTHHGVSVARLVLSSDNKGNDSGLVSGHEVLRIDDEHMAMHVHVPCRPGPGATAHAP